MARYKIQRMPGPAGEVSLRPTRSFRVLSYLAGAFFLYLMVMMFITGVEGFRDSAAIGALLLACSLTGGLLMIARLLPFLGRWEVLRVEGEWLEVDRRLTPYRVGSEPRRIPLSAIRRVGVERSNSRRYTLVLQLAGSASAEIPVVEEDLREDAVALALQLSKVLGCSAGGPPKPRSEPAGVATPRRSIVHSAIQIALMGLLACGGLGFIGGFIAAAIPWGETLDAIELPLGGAEGLAVDRDGRIYVGSPVYRRVQRYSPDGHFERGWYICCYKGAWRLGADRDGVQLDIGTHAHYALDDRGPARLLGDGEARRMRSAIRLFQALDGALYQLHRIPITVLRDGETVVSQGLLYLPVTAALPAWLTGLLAALGLWASQAWGSSSHRRRQEDVPM